jgi:hypothetical protein
MPLPSRWNSKSFVLVAFTAGILCTCTHAQSPAQVPLGTIAFEWIDNRIFVPVTINGEGPFHLILDTGANLAVSPEVARAERVSK